VEKARLAEGRRKERSENGSFRREKRKSNAERGEGGIRTQGQSMRSSSVGLMRGEGKEGDKAFALKRGAPPSRRRRKEKSCKD